MGEANMMFARGEYEETTAMCKEVIRIGRNEKQSLFYLINEKTYI